MSIGLIGDIQPKKVKKGAKGKSGQNNVIVGGSKEAQSDINAQKSRVSAQAAKATGSIAPFISQAAKTAAYEKGAQYGKSTVPDTLTNAVVDTPTSASAALLAEIMGYQSKANAGGSGTANFSGNLADYIAKAGKAIPVVSYASEVAGAKKNAAAGQKDISSMYSALAAYTAGQKPQVAQQYADSAANLKSTSADAAALGNSIYASLQGNMEQGAGSLAPGAALSAAVGQDAALQQNASHQSALADSLALGAQSAQVNNTSQGNAAQGWITNSGNAAQLAGTQSKADLTKALVNQLAQFSTLQSQADAAKAAQALQLGESQFNSDRSYAQSQAAAAQAANDSEFNRLIQKYQLQSAADSAANPSLSLSDQLKASIAQDSDAQSTAKTYASIYNALIAQGEDPATAAKNAAAAAKNAYS